jgi:hypothetical protein
VEKDNPQVQAPELASTYLNLCAVYSELGHFSEAVEKALKSVMLIRNHLQKVKTDLRGNDLPRVLKLEKSKEQLSFG